MTSGICVGNASTEAPNIEDTDMNLNGLCEHTVFLNFDGGVQLYRNAQLGVELPVALSPSGVPNDRRAAITERLNRSFAGHGVRFVSAAGTAAAHTIHIGGTGAFDRLGDFSGISEGIGEGNAFVMLDASAGDNKLLSVISHEAGHILGLLDHGGRGLQRYAYHKVIHDYFAASSILSDSDFSLYLRRKTTTTVTCSYLTAPSEIDHLSIRYSPGGTEEEYMYSAYYRPWYSRPETDYVTKSLVDEMYISASGTHAESIDVYGGHADGCITVDMFVTGSGSQDYYESKGHYIGREDVWTASNFNYYQGTVDGCSVSKTLQVRGNAVARQCDAYSIIVSGYLEAIAGGSDVETDTGYEYKGVRGLVENCTATNLTVYCGGDARNIILSAGGEADIGGEYYWGDFDKMGYGVADNLIVESGRSTSPRAANCTARKSTELCSPVRARNCPESSPASTSTSPASLPKPTSPSSLI